jgi:hypothetical protein
MRYAIITGTGRSGTNWLLDTLDASAHTHCRNEPHGLRGSALNEFPWVWKSPDAGSIDYYRQRWDALAMDTSSRFGFRDHQLRYPKDYINPVMSRLGVARFATGKRGRRPLALIDRAMARDEWELRPWLGSRRRLEDSLGVLKIIVDGPFVSWLTSERPEVPLVHIVRHPGGRLNSWLTRFAEKADEEGLERHRARRASALVLIRDFDADWRRRIPEVESLSLVELEMWFWSYVNETTWLAGRGRESYFVLTYDDLTREPLRHAREVYAHLELPWNSQIEQRVRADTGRSVWGTVADSSGRADAWRDRLDPAGQAAIDAVLEHSPLRELVG